MRTLRFAGKRLAYLSVAASLFLALVAGSPVLAQNSNTGAESQQSPYLEPVGNEESDGSAPQLTFRLTAEIALPGPLPGSGPRIHDGKIYTPVAGGVAVSDWTENSEVFLAAADSEEHSDAGLTWSVAPDGRIRVAMLEDGLLMAQKQCKRCRAGWKKKWKLRVSGSVAAPPLVTDKRVYYGALDNRVYCVQRKNGHRLWETDVDGRASRRLMIWRGTVASLEVLEATPWEGRPLEVILVVPENGAGIAALDAATGVKVASYRLPEDEGWLVGAPLLTPDGKIVIARQKYAAADASLLVFHIVELQIPGETEESDI